MHTSIATFALSSLLAFASAQQNYVIAPDSVDDSLKDFWCAQQKRQCPLICLQTTTGAPNSNDCTASDLTYACVCSDGFSPNLTQYSQTLPFFICQEWGTQCVANCGPTNAECADSCRADNPCGAQSPRLANSSIASATPSATSSGSSSGGDTIQTGFANGGGNSGSDGGAGGQGNGAVGAFGARTGWAVLLSALTLGFAVAL